MALPALDYLREALPDAGLDFACAVPFRKMLQPFLEKRRIRWISAEAPDFSAYDAGLFLNTDSRLLFRAWRSRLTIRVGTLGRWPAFLWLNRGLRQRRSSGEKNEGLYTLELAQRLVALMLGREVPLSTEPAVVLEGNEEDRKQANAFLKKLGVREGDPFIVLHPGTGGTAINVPREGFVEIARNLETSLGLPLLLCQGPSPVDAELIAMLREKYRPLPVIEGQELEVIREIFRRATAVVGPSTGTLHLAHAVGTRTLGLFAPIRAQAPPRWGFWGGRGKGEILVPQVDCPGTSECIGPRCKEYFCMEKLPWGRLILDWGNALKREL